MKHFENRGFRIQYDSWGNPDHRAVLFFHGFPGSHVQARALLPLLETHKLFLISCDRPGYGGTIGVGSDVQYLHALQTLLEDHLKIREYHILGVSGGSPFAHLMASLFAEKVKSLSVVCGLATYNRETKNFFSKMQNRAMMVRKFVPRKMAEVLINGVARGMNPDVNPEQLISLLDQIDREVLRQPHNVKILTSSMQHARSQGAKGIAFDSALFHRDWLRKLCVPERLATMPVFYFHGVRDTILNHRMSEWMHRSVRGSKLKFFDEEGHYSLPFRQAGHILENIAHLVPGPVYGRGAP